MTIRELWNDFALQSATRWVRLSSLHQSVSGPLVHLTLHVIKPQSPSLREPAYSKPDLGNAPGCLHLLNYNDVYSCNIPETKPHLDAVHVVLLAPGSYLVQLKHISGAEASLSSFLALFTSSNVLKQPRVTVQVNLAAAAATWGAFYKAFSYKVSAYLCAVKSPHGARSGHEDTERAVYELERQSGFVQSLEKRSWTVRRGFGTILCSGPCEKWVNKNRIQEKCPTFLNPSVFMYAVSLCGHARLHRLASAENADANSPNICRRWV